MPNELIFGCLLVIAAVLVVIGAAIWSVAVGFVVAGILVGALAWLFFGDVAE